MINASLQGWGLGSQNIRKLFPIFNLPFLGRVIKRVVSTQLQKAVDEANYLDTFQFGFRSGYSTEMALVTLVNDLETPGWVVVQSF